jgi:hypothetical protein
MQFFTEQQRVHQAFRQAVGDMSPPIEGLEVNEDGVRVLSSCPLYNKGVRLISGFSKYDGDCYEIAFKNEHNKLLSDEQAMDAGLEGQVHTFDASELRSFLEKLVNQTL